MRCPTCGHNNNDLATRCSECGSQLPEAINAQSPAPLSADPEATIPQATTPHDMVSAHNDTAERQLVVTDVPTAQTSDPHLREVASTAGRFVTSKHRRLTQIFRAHEKAFGIGLAICVVGIMGVVWLVLSLTNAPTYTQIESDMSALIPTAQYAGGTYGPDLEIPLSSIVVTGRSATQTPEGLEASEGVGPAAYGVQAEATYDDGRIKVVRNVSSTYIRSENGWVLSGDLAEQGTSFTARSGVDEGKVLANMESVLSSASSEDGTSLADIYANGTFAIVGNDFEESPDHDTATDDVVVHCSQQDGYSTYEGNVTARFAFESGEWRLRGAEADQQATTRTYDPLVGTWSGSLVSHEAEDGSCFGAQEHSLTITIDSVGDASGGQASVSGTISCVAHFHERLDYDEAVDEGDTVLERMAFSGALSSQPGTSAASGINLEGATAGSPEGDLTFVVSFGTADDPSAVVARVTTTHSYEELLLFLLPHQTTTRFVDTYLLTRTS